MSDTAVNPFDILPLNLFNLFGSQTLQRHYMAVLLRLYGLAEFNRFGLTRETVIAEIIDYLKTDGAAEAVQAEIDEVNGGRANSSGRGSIGGQASDQEYASFVLRRLAETGWIEREQNSDYSETIILPDYAFTLLEAFRTIQEQKPREYAGQLYTAHQLLTQNQRSKNFSPALAVTQAYENVRQVVRGLNELNHNIRRYIERATRGLSVAELLRLQYDDYAQTLGPNYHALKTSDHVSRYRRDIINQLQKWQRNQKWLERTAEELAVQVRLSPAQASQEINHYLEFIMHQLEGLDPLLEEIDRRHAQYLSTSLRQIRYQLVSADGGFKDRLVVLAQQLATLINQGLRDLPAAAPGWQLYPVKQPDAHSFYTPPQKRAPFKPAGVTNQALAPQDLLALRTATLQDVTQALSPGRVDRLVNSFFNGHNSLHVTELPPEIQTDVHWLTTIIAYSYHPEVSYGLETVAGPAVTVGEYYVLPFELVKL